MARPGFIHGKLDIKLLILYLMARVAAPIDFATLTDLSLCDDGVDYFLFAEAVPELVDSAHLSREGELYSITEKGRRACADGESSLSPVIRRRCDQRLAPLNAALQRREQVRGRVEELPGGELQVRLELGDGQGQVFTLTLTVSTRQDAEEIVQRFTRQPQRVFNGILGVLLSDSPQKGGNP